MQRFVVEYETNGEGTMRSVPFPSRSLAVRHAKLVTTNDTAFPAEARINKETRTSIYAEWETDRAFQPFDVVAGEVQ